METLNPNGEIGSSALVGDVTAHLGDYAVVDFAQRLYTVELEAQPVRVGLVVPATGRGVARSGGVRSAGAPSAYAPSAGAARRSMLASGALRPPLPPAGDIPGTPGAGAQPFDTAQSNGDVQVATMQGKGPHGNAGSEAECGADPAVALSALAIRGGATGGRAHGTMTKEAAMNGAQADQTMVGNAAMIGVEATSVAATAGIPLKVSVAGVPDAAEPSAAPASVPGESPQTVPAVASEAVREGRLRVPDAASFPEPVYPGTIPVVGAAIMRDGKILCARRPFDKNLGGKWEFPGGKVKPGETYREALAREIREELGCEITVGDQVCTTLNTYRFGTISLVTFRCTLKPGEEPKRLEHLKLRWMDPLDMPSLDWAPADYEAVDLISIESQA